MDYNYPQDGKLHTRYHELAKCTPGQIHVVIAERLGQLQPFENDVTFFGSERHGMFEKYIKANATLPKHFDGLLKSKFGLSLDLSTAKSEQEIASEMFNGVVIHGRPDLFGQDWIIDFKTTTNPERFSSSRQTLFYAWLLQPHGLTITKTYFLFELWNKDRTEILGYECLAKDITDTMLDEINEWALHRARLLYAALRSRQ